MRILVIPEKYGNFISACGWIRLVQPYQFINKTTSNFVRIGDWSDIQKWNPDIVVTQRIQANNKTVGYLELIAKNDIRLIFDLDDNLLEITEDHPDKLHYLQFVNPIREFLQASSLVTVSTEAMRQSLTNIVENVKIRIIPNEIDFDHWMAEAKFETSQINVLKNEKSSLVPDDLQIIYFGTLSHIQDWASIKTEITDWLSNNKNSKITLIGLGKDQFENHPQIRALQVPGFPSVSYPAFISWMRNLPISNVGLAPLIDNSFNKSKSNIKLLEYAAMGVVPISSPLPEYSYASNELGIGLNAKIGSWGSILDQLLDPATRETYKFAGFKSVRENCTISKTSTGQIRLNAVLQELGM